MVASDVDFTEYQPIYATKVSYYQGDQMPSANVILLRFERIDNKNTGLSGEHISVVYDIIDNKLMGYTRMQSHLNNESCVAHQQARQTAIKFLKMVAPDLISNDAQMPELNELESSERMVFESVVRIGNVELNWVSGHYEIIKINGIEKHVYGMKVKFFIPSNNLWGWVIIDKNNQVETFERNVSWNFVAKQRQTQMWLHDSWLIEQGITLIKIA